MEKSGYFVNMAGIRRDMAFPYQVERLALSRHNHPVKFSRSTYHDRLEFCVRLSAEPSEATPRQVINGKVYDRITYPHVVIKPPCAENSIMNFSRRDVLYIIYPGSMVPLWEKNGIMEGPLCWNIHINRELELLFGLLEEHCAASLTPGGADRIDILCFQIIHELLLMKKSATAPVDREHELMLRADSWLRLHLCDEIDFREVAKIFGMSRSTFFRYWKRYSPLSPADYLLELRLQEAAHRLETSRERVSEIAANLQLGESAYMGVRFKKKFGITPLKYRTLHSVSYGTSNKK